MINTEKKSLDDIRYIIIKQNNGTREKSLLLIKKMICKGSEKNIYIYFDDIRKTSLQNGKRKWFSDTREEILLM